MSTGAGLCGEAGRPELDRRIGALEERGQWRTKVQSVFNPVTRALGRQTYTVLDFNPSRDLEFSWQPNKLSRPIGGRIRGAGRLTWVLKNRPSYDPSSVFAAFRGTFVEGRLEGQGSYAESSGLKYEGQWRHGLMNGAGKLQLPDGSEYVGNFVDGDASGQGRLIDITGELYEGRFAHGRRDGQGITTLPNGISYPSFWLGGQETERSRGVRVAQAGNTAIPTISDDVRIGIAVDRRLPAQVVGSDRALWYAVSNSAGGFQIRPGNSRLLKMWREKAELQLTFLEEVQEFGTGILGQTKQQLVPLNLRVELQNRSSRDIQVNGLYLDVQTSTTETKPAIQINVGSITDCNGLVEGAYSSGFTIKNYGWSVAEDVGLKLDLIAPQAPDSPMKISKALGNLDKTVRLDIESDLKAMGVDTNYLGGLQEGFICDPKTPSVCLNRLRAAGKFGRLANYVQMQDTTFVLRFAGVLHYTWHDAQSKVQSWENPFTATLPLGFIKPTAFCGAEGGGPQIITTKTQQFKLDATAYKIPVAYQTTISSSRTVPLVFPLEAPKASSHDFVVVVQLADGREIRSRPINLLYYRPRWFNQDEAPDRAFGDELSDDGLYLANYALNGADLKQIQSPSGDGCSSACKADRRCVGFTEDQWSAVCYLKSEITSMRHDPRSSSNLKKGIKRPPLAITQFVVQRFSKRKFDNEWPYRANLNSTVDECEQSCKKYEDCTAYNFVGTTRVCFLFDEGVTKPSPISTIDSGVKFQPAQ
ncbi:PAN domain-containing protein [Bradyrhizobium canariense]|uniref:PAN domain-containing protein n=1 Tax=Bradyrhizobium canariense TaxID=255045 RepID=UPI00137474A6|nr:PAN domain-containing protein [Bradyrhizobium canariense]